MNYSKNDWKPLIIDKEHLTKNIDKCYKDPIYYQTQTGIDLMSKAQYLLH
ncbi:hypothetical protein Goshw_005283 [Gossypium schwendimanii]|uniref:Uncharacterized protein n=1 Tax=Gossypium schwendimanii TaxID=34291 RepID=A0A7J9KJL9_GOSSC|nr:hypothetical protein [Gossypium schwendimanii]